MENYPIEFVGIEAANISVKSENSNVALEQLISQNYLENGNIKGKESSPRICENNFVKKDVDGIALNSNQPKMFEDYFGVTVKEEHSDADENVVDVYTFNSNNIKPELVVVDSILKCETEESVIACDLGSSLFEESGMSKCRTRANSYIEEHRSYGGHHVWLTSADAENFEEGSEGVCFQCQDYSHEGSTLFKNRARFENFQSKQQEAVYDNLKPPDCGENFSRKQNLKSHHMAKHLKVKSFKCPDCDKCFLRKSQIKVHQKSVHDKLKPCKCPNCKMSFYKEAYLKVHIEAVHLKLKPRKCPDCEQRFYSKSHLTAHHESVHRMLKPHKCSDCDNSFHSKQSLNRHHIAKHSKLRPHKCPDCDKCFSRQDMLKAHQGVVHHKRKLRKCPECDLNFDKESDLRVHVESVHFKLKPHKCPDCDNSYSLKQSFKNHSCRNIHK